MVRTAVIATPDDIKHFAQSHLKDISATIRQRVLIERAVIRHAVTAMIAEGCAISVNYGEGEFPVKKSQDIAAIMEAVGACDEEWLNMSIADMQFISDAKAKATGSAS